MRLCLSSVSRTTNDLCNSILYSLKFRTLKNFGAKTRCPCVILPKEIELDTDWPNTVSKLICPSSLTPLNTQRMECIGRTHLSLPTPQRMDFGQRSSTTESLIKPGKSELVERPCNKRLTK